MAWWESDQQMNAEVILTVEEMQDKNLWLEVRNTGIGGSDAAVIVGMNKWKSPLTLWLEKTGQKEPDDLSDNERVYWGVKNEANIADWFTEKTGKKVIRKGLMRSKDYPWMLATVDRMVVGEEAGLEIKTAGVDQAKKWLEDEIPDMYYLQCQWYMAVTGLAKWYIAVLIGGNEAKFKVVERNEDQIKELIKAGQDFWEKVQKKIMPAVDGSKDCGSSLGLIYGQSNGEAINLPLQAAEIIKKYDEIKASIADLEKIKITQENLLKEILGENEIGTLQLEDSVRKVTWKTQKGKKTTDYDKLKKDFINAYTACVKVGKPFRKFNLY